MIFLEIVMNESGLRPLGRSVLVEPYTPERKESIIVLPDEVQGRQQMVDQRAVVIEVGPGAWCDEPEARAKPGDKVLIARYSGFMAKGTKDDKQYLFVNDRDIFAAIEVES
jgi:co-chaperonin GroES (HSP10)